MKTNKPDKNFHPANGLKYVYNESAPVTNTHISQYSKKQQSEWAAIKPYDKNSNKGLSTLAPQRMQSAFKDAVRGGW